MLSVVPSLSLAHLESLEEKYFLITALRTARATRGELASRDTLRGLATRFPGALRELDTLPDAVLHARLSSLRQAVLTGSVPYWAPWIADYHTLMRATLALKSRLRRGRTLDPALASLEAQKLCAQTGFSLDERYVFAVARPPRGRLGVLVFDTLSARYGVAPETLWQELFPTRRASRFTLDDRERR